MGQAARAHRGLLQDQQAPLRPTSVGQGARLGVYRGLVLSVLAFLLAHWAYLAAFATSEPDGGRAAHAALEQLLPGV
jgi:hypothetical protein